MTRARDIADLVDSNGDIVAGALDNVPAADLVNDTTPQLGGNLDAQENIIASASRLQVGRQSITQAYTGASNGYVADFQGHSSSGQTFISIAAPNVASLGDGGTIIGEDLTDTYVLQRTTKNIKLATNDLNRLVIDGSTGYVTKPYQVAFSATPANGNYSTTSPIPFDVVHYNIGNAYNNSTYTFTAPIAGRYVFHLHLGIVRLLATNASGYPRFNINGANKEYSYVAGPSGLYVNANMTTFRVLSANDTVKVVWNGSNADYYDNTSECSFSGYLLG